MRTQLKVTRNGLKRAFIQVSLGILACFTLAIPVVLYLGIKGTVLDPFAFEGVVSRFTSHTPEERQRIIRDNVILGYWLLGVGIVLFVGGLMAAQRDVNSHVIQFLLIEGPLLISLAGFQTVHIGYGIFKHWQALQGVLA